MTPQVVEATTTRANAQIDPTLSTWGWEIVIYLFLGGIVAGILILTSSLELSRSSRPRSRVLAWMPLVALALLSVGMLALWLDLAHRLWAWRFYATWKVTSPMSWGAWILVLLYPTGILLWLGTLEDAGRTWLQGKTPALGKSVLQRSARWAGRHRGRLLKLSLALGIGLGIYTGLLLGTMPSRLAWNSAIMGPLFLLSGISTGAAVLLLHRLDEEERRLIVRWDALAIIAELGLIALILVGWATSGAAGRFAAHLFLGGPYTAVFWSVVVILGLLVPLAMEAVEARRHLKFAAIVPVLILSGGLALRWILLLAGESSSFRFLP
jgi:protein NrfD